ncbi:MAG TPA: TetR/AcrR family transcriptional regulator [Bacteroidales bacterium]
MNDTKQYIMDVAVKLFLQKSYKEVTMKDIVEKTGLSKGAFYHYFESKEQLFLEILDYFLSHMFVLHFEKYSQESLYQFFSDYLKDIKRLSADFIKNGHGEYGFFDMNYYLLIFDGMKLLPEFRDKMASHHKKEIEVWASAIERAKKSGEIRSELTSEQLAKMIIYMGDGIGMHLIMQTEDLNDMEQTYGALWEGIYKSLKA